MNLQELKEIIDKYKNEIDINHPKCKNNRILLLKYNNLFKSISEMIYLIKNYNNLENFYIFCICGKKNNFINITKGYHKYCSMSCLNKSQEHINKIRNNAFNDIDKNGLNSYQRANKKSANTMKNTICKNGLSIKQNIILKSKQTKLNNIDKDGLNSYQRQSIKCKNTRLNDIDENGLNSYKRCIIKLKQTNILKYGVTNYYASQEFLNKYNNKQWLLNKQLKEYQTKKKNNSFNKSKQEEQVYNYLLQKFNKNDIERQYKSKLYPFCSDFYIKSLDLYIECNFHWTHCPLKNKFKPFKNSVEDLQELEKLKNKNSKYYNIAKNVWTKLDPLKLQIFKKNKLKHKIFYKIEQFLSWFNKI